MLPPELFRGALFREKKRAERFDQPFVLVLVNATSALNGDGDRFWRSCVSALNASKRDSDVVGWLVRGATLGLILPDITTSRESLANDIETRVRGKLDSWLDRSLCASVSVRAYLYSRAPMPAAEPTAADAVCQQFLPARECGRLQALGKRALDVAGSAALLLFLSPLLAVIPFLVKFRSPGPVLFRQKRIGQSGRPFEMLKFRTMHVNGDEKLHQDYVTWFIKSSAQAKNTADTVFKLTADPRITVAGHLLRKTSLDELPQLWNVLRGDMSLVGPRPPLQYEVDQYQPWHWGRVLEARPGITGLWQVNGRSRTTFDDMVRLDLRYARCHSVWTDIRILLATPRAVISGKGAC